MTDLRCWTQCEEQADKFAEQSHRGQYRKDGKTPYITHPRRVAKCVRDYGGTHIAIIGAYLHDVKEDTDADVDGFVSSLSCIWDDDERKEIIDIVNALTVDESIHPRRVREQEYRNRIKSAPKSAMLIKLCDRLDNLLDTDGMDRKFMDVYLEETRLLLEEFGEECNRHQNLCMAIRKRMEELK